MVGSMKSNKQFYYIAILSALTFAILLSACSTPAQGQSDLPGLTPGQNPTPTRPPWCVPYPVEPTSSEPPTPTPNILTPQPPPPEAPTRTPYPIAHLVDLYPEVPSEDKGTALVYRCNGELDEYLYDPVKFHEYSDLLKQLDLKPGDFVSLVPPASVMMHQIATVGPSYQVTQNHLPTLLTTPAYIPPYP
jgi:hypothetical protein